MIGYLFLPDASSRKLETNESDAGFVENTETNLFNVENTLYYCQTERITDEWLNTVSGSVGQSPIPTENLAAERGVMDFETMLYAAEPNAAQAAATTSDAHTDQPELWNSMLDSDTFTALISTNALAADLEQLEHVEQKPIISYGTATLRSNPLLSYIVEHFPSDPMDLSGNNRVSGDFSSIPSTEVDSKSASTFLQSPSIDKLGPEATYLRGPASRSDAFSMPKSIDLELQLNSSLSTDLCTSQGTIGDAIASNLIILRSAASKLVSDTSDKYTVIRQLKKKLELRALHCYKPSPPVVNHIPTGNPNVTVPLHFITKQSISPEKATEKPTTSQSFPTQTSVRIGLTATSSSGLICTAQSGSSTKSTKQFTCGGCGKLFFAYTVFKKHLSSHNTKSEYRCNWPDCGILEKSYRRLSRHYLQHVPKSDIRKCEKCGKTFDSFSHLTLHKQRVHTKDRFLCTVLGCYCTYKRINGLSKHIREKHPEKTFNCSKCDRMYGLENELKKHKCSFLCSFPGCRRGYNTAAGLDSHYINKHGKKTFDCSKCNNPYASKVQLQKHRCKATQQSE